MALCNAMMRLIFVIFCSHINKLIWNSISVLSTDRSGRSLMLSLLLLRHCPENVWVFQFYARQVSSLKHSEWIVFCCVVCKCPFHVEMLAFPMSYGRAPWLYRNWFVWLLLLVQHCVLDCLYWEIQFQCKRHRKNANAITLRNGLTNIHPHTQKNNQNNCGFYSSNY